MRLVMPRTSPYSITLSSSEKAALENIARQYTSPYYQVVRAKVILMAAQGLRNDQIAAQVSPATDRQQVAQAFLRGTPPRLGEPVSLWAPAQFFPLN